MVFVKKLSFLLCGFFRQTEAEKIFLNILDRKKNRPEKGTFKNIRIVEVFKGVFVTKLSLSPCVLFWQAKAEKIVS